MNFLKRIGERINRAIKGWRTIVANLLFMIVPILELTELKAVLPAEFLPWYALGVVVANMALRKITTTPLGRNWPTVPRSPEMRDVGSGP